MRCALTHPQIVRALILIDTQAGLEDPSKLAGYHEMMDDWTTNGLSDQVAAIIESIILGDGWSGAEYWKNKWRTMKAVNVAGSFATLTARDDITRAYRCDQSADARRRTAMRMPPFRCRSRTCWWSALPARDSR